MSLQALRGGWAVAVGDVGAPLEFDGLAWRAINPGTGHGLLTVTRFGQNWVAAGREGTVLAKEGSAGLKKSGPVQVMGIARGDTGQLLIVGALGTIHMPQVGTGTRTRVSALKGRACQNALLPWRLSRSL